MFSVCFDERFFFMDPFFPDGLQVPQILIRWSISGMSNQQGPLPAP